MSSEQHTYDQYYQTANLFGDPYPELLEYFQQLSPKGKVLDMGCGQGRDAIALARMGYQVFGIDVSSVGISQMLRIASEEGLALEGQAADLYAWEDFEGVDIVLLDSMLHFSKHDREKEKSLVRKIIKQLAPKGRLVVCIQDVGKKVDILRQTMLEADDGRTIEELPFSYTFRDNSSGHSSRTPYRLIALSLV
ncbi:MAG: class I SAM-dependent methyltransferase [Bacteroidota bacterium]